MTATSNRKIVEDIYTAFEQGDVPAVIAALDAEVVWTYPGPSNIPYTGVFDGVQAVERYFATYAAQIAQATGSATPPNFFGTEAFVADGDLVLVLGFEVTTIAATGKTYNAPFAHAWTLTDGKVTRFCGYYDTAAMSAAFT